jgi:hypothetical protein
MSGLNVIIVDQLKKSGLSMILLVAAIIYLKSEIDVLRLDLQKCNQEIINILLDK